MLGSAETNHQSTLMIPAIQRTDASGCGLNKSPLDVSGALLRPDLRAEPHLLHQPLHEFEVDGFLC
jgi:hypothetical protein